MQKTSWLFSHSLLLSLCFGSLYGLIIGGLVYLTMHSLGYFWPPFADLPGYLLRFLSYFIPFGIPVIATFPPIVKFKAPRFSFNSLRIYAVSFWLCESAILYFDPFHSFLSGPQGLDRLYSVLLVTTVQFLFLALLIVLAPQIVQRCGYRLVLNGSIFTFEVGADLKRVSGELEKLEEDFKLYLDRRSSALNRLLFAKRYEKENVILQLFLQPNNDKTDVTIVMHSIENDIPMRVSSDTVERFGKTLMTWLEAGNGFTVFETETERLDEIVQESKKSFLRQPFALPSKKSVGGFAKAHWKDIGLIISILLTLVAWLFPRQ